MSRFTIQFGEGAKYAGTIAVVWNMILVRQAMKRFEFSCLHWRASRIHPSINSDSLGIVVVVLFSVL